MKRDAPAGDRRHGNTGVLDRIGIGRIRVFEHPVVMVFTTIGIASAVGRQWWIALGLQLFFVSMVELSYRVAERDE